jgi:hypothetical protein
VIVPSALAHSTVVRWPLASAMPPPGALGTAPGSARAHVQAVLPRWHLADLADDIAMPAVLKNAIDWLSRPFGSSPSGFADRRRRHRFRSVRRRGPRTMPQVRRYRQRHDPRGHQTRDTPRRLHK